MKAPLAICQRYSCIDYTPSIFPSDASRVVVWGILDGIVIHKAIDLRKEAAINSSSRETSGGCLDGGLGIPGSNRPS